MNFLSMDALQKDTLAQIIGGAVASANKKCACICFGPSEDGDEIEQPTPEDGDCADCGASNAFRVTPEQ